MFSGCSWSTPLVRAWPAPNQCPHEAPTSMRQALGSRSMHHACPVRNVTGRKRRICGTFVGKWIVPQAAQDLRGHSLNSGEQDIDLVRVRYNRVIPHSAVGRHGHRWSRTMRTVLALSESPNHSQPLNRASSAPR